MKRFILTAILAGFVILLAACGSSTSYSRSSAPSGNAPAVAAPATSSTRAPAATTTPAARAAAATPAANPVERVSGTVQRVEGDRVSLTEGGSFTVTDQTAITRREPGTAAALQPGRTVAVTAKRQPDNTLLASLVTVFPTAPNGLPLGQRPLDGGNLMTNATVDTVQGSAFTVTFPGGGARVNLAPDAKISLLAAGSRADITVGEMVSASVRDGVAQTLSIQ